MPSSASHYTSGGTAYSKALIEPVCPAGWQPLNLEVTGPSVAGGVADAMKVWGEVKATELVELRVESGGKVIAKTAKVTRQEALGFLVFHYRQYSEKLFVRTIETESRLTAAVQHLEKARGDCRHQWAVGGGEVLQDRGNGFVTFFGACIREWAR